jgi:hypothetical protein
VVVMSEVREDLGIGLCHVEPSAQENNGMEAKFRISQKLGIKNQLGGTFQRKGRTEIRAKAN